MSLQKVVGKASLTLLPNSTPRLKKQHHAHMHEYSDTYMYVQKHITNLRMEGLLNYNNQKEDVLPVGSKVSL